MGKVLILIGLAIVALGAILYYFPSAFSRIGKLPGDFSHRSGNFTFHFPLATCLLLSLLLSLIFRIVRRFL